MNDSPPITDSPWFWALLYSAVPLVFLTIMSGKYGERQSRLERQYQGRVRAAEADAPEAAAADEVPALDATGDEPAEGRRPFSSPENMLIPLLPLILVFLAIAAFAAVMLIREQRRLQRNVGRPGLLTDGNAPP